MIAHVVRGIANAIPAVLGVILVVFVLLHLSGDPTQILLPMNAPPEQRAAFRKAYGLDRPVLVHTRAMWRT